MPENAFRRFYWAELIKTQQTQPLWEYKQHYSFYNTPPSSQNMGPPRGSARGSPGLQIPLSSPTFSLCNCSRTGTIIATILQGIFENYIELSFIGVAAHVMFRNDNHLESVAF